MGVAVLGRRAPDVGSIPTASTILSAGLVRRRAPHVSLATRPTPPRGLIREKAWVPAGLAARMKLSSMAFGVGLLVSLTLLLVDAGRLDARPVQIDVRSTEGASLGRL